MDAQLQADITRRLITDFAFKERGQWLREGKCPSCNQKSLYTHENHPWVVKCGRLNNCAYTEHVKEIYPDIFRSWSDRYQATPADPRAAATAYLQQARGLNTAALGDCYTQESYYDNRLKAGSATVRFTLAPGVQWERLIDQPERFGDRKAGFTAGSHYAGLWWQPPHVDWRAAKEVWITEGIFDALSLRQHGIAAVSAMSSGNYPEKSMAELEKALGRKVPLVFALDSDESGRRFSVKFVKRAIEAGWEATAAQITDGIQAKGQKRDWNDLHQAGDITPEKIKIYRQHGQILLTTTANEKGLLLYKLRNENNFWFTHRKQTFWFNLNLDKYNKAIQALEEADEGMTLTADDRRDKALSMCGAVSLIASCTIDFLYHQRNEISDESWHYIRVEMPNHSPVKATTTATQTTSLGEFKKRLMHITGAAMFTGNQNQLESIVKTQTTHIRRVNTIDFVGYSIEHGCWVFDNIAIKDGRVTRINEEDFFDIGSLYIKSIFKAQRSQEILLNPEKTDYRKDWLPLLWQTFGTNGLITLTFFFGSLFAEQIRAQYKSYPFLEMTGEPGTGKTTLVKFLWKLLGRADYEGFNPSISSGAGRYRNFSQVGNLPVVLLEGDKGHDESNAKQKRFDFNELKPLFNGNAIRERGVATGGNETYAPPFRGSIVIEQNSPVMAEEAVLSRICHLLFTKENNSNEKQKTAAKLEGMERENLSYFSVAAALREKDILNTIADRFQLYVKQLQQEPRVKEYRIVQNHAMLMAILDALTLVLPNITDDMKAQCARAIHAMAVERQQTINADHPIVQEFWEAYEFLNGTNDKPRLNHTREPGLIAINLNHFYDIATHAHQRLPPVSELKRHLKNSRQFKYLDQRVVNSRIGDTEQGYGKVVRCWIFSDGKNW